jgi:hypothetical protein
MLSGMQKRPKRPRDPNQLGKLIVDLSVGETIEPTSDDSKDPSAVALGKKGGKARAAKLTKKQRIEIAKKAATRRWSKNK